MNKNLIYIGIVSSNDIVLRLFFPIQTIYYLSLGISYTELGISLVVFCLATAILEYPSGYLADVWGRKKTLFLGTLAFFGALLVLYITNSAWHLYTAYILMAVGYAANSGADQALLYDNLKAEQQEHQYDYVWSKIQFWSSIVAALFSLASGFLALLSYRTPYLLAIIIYIPVIISCSLIKENYSTHKTLKSVKDKFQGLSSTFQSVFPHRKDLIWLFIASALISSVSWTAQHLVYPPLVNDVLQLPLYFLGITFFVFHMARALTSHYAQRIRELLSGNKIYFFMIGVVGISLLIITHFPLALVLVFPVLIDCAETLKKIIVSADINQRIESSRRASILSLDGLGKWIFWGMYVLIVGLATDYLGFIWACQIQVALVLVTFIWLYSRRSFIRF